MADTLSSKLESPSERYLSLFLQFALTRDWLSPHQVVQEFPPLTMMLALESAEGLRAQILVQAAGVHEKIAPKKSTSAAAEDLQIALDEKICSPAKLLGLFRADDLAHYLNPQAVWAFATRDGFWERDDARGRERMLQALQAALDEELLDLPRLVRAVGAERLAKELPKELLERGLVEAIGLGLDNGPLSPGKLLFTLPLTDWVEHVPLAHLWEKVVLGEIAASAGYAPVSGEARAQASAATKHAVPVQASAVGKPTAAVAIAVAPAQSAVAVDAGESSPSPPSGNSPSSPPRREEVAARERALENLKGIDREPRHPDNLSTPLLLAIDGMYAELLQMTDDESRADCIRDAFPNDKLLEDALFAIAETLDPKLDEQSLRAKGPSADSLIQLVLFEERRRNGSLTGRSSSPPPVPHAGEPGGVLGLPPLPPPKRSMLQVPPLPPPGRKTP